MTNARRSRRRPGFTLAESLIALAALSAAMVLVAQFVLLSLAERARTDARAEAVEVATNALEQSRDKPWTELTAEWGNAQKLPDHMAVRWHDCVLTVRVEPEPGRPRVKKVTVELKWTSPGRSAWSPVQLTGWFAARSTEGKS